MKTVIYNIIKFSSFRILLAFIGLIAVGSLSSCSEEDAENLTIDKRKKTKISISLEGLTQKSKSSELPNITDESAIYSLEVLIFNSNGSLDGYTSVPRKLIDVKGFSYYKSYAEIDEVKDITLSRGIHDIYVVGNAPDNFFANINTYNDFKTKYENLSSQGLFLADGATIAPDTEGSPNSGYAPSDWKTNLTMCGFAKAVDVSDVNYSHFYLGYTANASGLPTGVTDGKAPLANNPFYLERLVARVAIRSITFNLPPTLEFETGQGVVLYEHELDSVFIVNGKSMSAIAADSPEASGMAYGSQNGYSLLQTSMTDIGAGTLASYLSEQIVPDYNGNYDIDNTANTPLENTPLWFYIFENKTSPITNPTYFVIVVKYYFRDSSSNIKVQRAYYPVMINRAGGGIVERNKQYRMAVTIKGLGLYKSPVTNVKSVTDISSFVAVEEEIGKNLFRWTGNVYK